MKLLRRFFTTLTVLVLASSLSSCAFPNFRPKGNDLDELVSIYQKYGYPVEGAGDATEEFCGSAVPCTRVITNDKVAFIQVAKESDLEQIIGLANWVGASENTSPGLRATDSAGKIVVVYLDPKIDAIQRNKFRSVLLQYTGEG